MNRITRDDMALTVGAVRRTRMPRRHSPPGLGHPPAPLADLAHTRQQGPLRAYACDLQPTALNFAVVVPLQTPPATTVDARTTTDAAATPPAEPAAPPVRATSVNHLTAGLRAVVSMIAAAFNDRVREPRDGSDGRSLVPAPFPSPMLRRVLSVRKTGRAKVLGQEQVDAPDYGFVRHMHDSHGDIIFSVDDSVYDADRNEYRVRQRLGHGTFGQVSIGAGRGARLFG